MLVDIFGKFGALSQSVKFLQYLSYVAWCPFCKMFAMVTRGETINDQISKMYCNMFMYMFGKFGAFITKCEIRSVYELCFLMVIL